MFLYINTKKGFLEDVKKSSIAYDIEEEFFFNFKRNISRSEINSWRSSIYFMSKILQCKEIPENAGIALEYCIPQTSKRIDFMISGYDVYGLPCIIVVELKQWTRVKAVKESDSLIETYTGGRIQRVVHPSYQAWSYASFLKDYNMYIQDNRAGVFPCVCMYNYAYFKGDCVNSVQFNDYISESPVFSKGQENDFREFICSHIVKGDSCAVIEQIEHSKIRPSKRLQDSVDRMIRGKREFIMVDEQRTVFENILDIAEKSYQSDRKSTVIVEGGAGTGKSIIAVNLVAELTKKGKSVRYVSKNTAPRTVYMKLLKGSKDKNSIENLFSGSGNYTQSVNNTFDVIVTDEAHRLTSKSGIFHDLGKNQIQEIIHACRCSAFFIDERQRITIGDIGTVSEIEKSAHAENSEVTHMKLVSQFRCGGNQNYIAWVDSILQIDKDKNLKFLSEDYDLRVFDSPEELRQLITEKNRFGNRSRIMGGYCWNRNKYEKNNPDFCNVEIGDFRMSWNIENSVFAFDKDSINQIGCIHVVQGLEFDYAGVIIGDDLRFEDGRVIVDFNKRADTDKSLHGIKKMYRENPEKAMSIAEELIKNTYRVLLTRGIKGCYIYCTDKMLSDYIKENISY